ncbi:hypothetical protein [Abyssisolibacter fermentans]|uniref:hypothetical protein n=1 Tax=Abyssisolibacter fermentans TaxID=1766203 RepID=UPI000835B323|nr:hypothetical protein [Abyssisolibacter fermentans]
MNYKDYERKKAGNYLSVGIFGKQFAFEILTGFCDTPEYYPISKEEYDSFDEWKEDVSKMPEIKNRKILCSGYRVL